MSGRSHVTGRVGAIVVGCAIRAERRFDRCQEGWKRGDPAGSGRSLRERREEPLRSRPGERAAGGASGRWSAGAVSGASRAKRAPGRRGRGSPRRPRLSADQIAQLERELERGPLSRDCADQRWTLARVRTLIGRLFHVSYTVETTWRLLKHHGWSWRHPARRAIEP
uniref:helix-turn-helix domain-containing protein n=1 Tax=Streptomyces finlayi TaxID=67296 RepID=UPI002156564F|nr:winged helix-turn-helix domain-containing protein [Streptomyces finlayi]